MLRSTCSMAGVRGLQTLSRYMALTGKLWLKHTITGRDCSGVALLSRQWLSQWIVRDRPSHVINHTMCVRTRNWGGSLTGFFSVRTEVLLVGLKSVSRILLVHFCPLNFEYINMTPCKITSYNKANHTQSYAKKICSEPVECCHYT